MLQRRAFSKGKGIMRAVVSNGKGDVFIEERPIPVPSSNEQLVKVQAIGVNRADLMQMYGKYPPPPGASDVLGLELSGTLECGKPVAAFVSSGAYAEYAAVPKSSILSLSPDVSESLTPVELAAIPEAFVAAYHFLFQKGELSENQTVLINAAASGVGTSAIQLAKTVPNATVIATASTQKKLDFCANLGANHTINYSKDSISEKVQEATKGAGVDLILDCVGANQYMENVRSLKMDGKWVMYGLLSGPKCPDIGLAGIVMKRLTIMGTTLRSRTPEYRGALVREFSDRFGQSFRRTGSLQPIVHRVFHKLESTEEALKYLQSNRNIGKLVIEL